MEEAHLSSRAAEPYRDPTGRAEASRDPGGPPAGPGQPPRHQHQRLAAPLGTRSPAYRAANTGWP